MKYLIPIILVSTILCAWCPWFEASEAQAIIDSEVSNLIRNEPNLCPLDVRKNTLQKAPFGYREEIGYNCSKLDSTLGIDKSKNTVFVTFYKQVIGMPQKTLKK